MARYAGPWRDQWTIGGLHVATFTGDVRDFPWDMGRLEPGPAFERFEPFLTRAEDGGRWMSGAAIAAEGYPPESWRVVLDPNSRIGKATIGPTYMCELVLFDFGDAAWRKSPRPAVLDE